MEMKRYPISKEQELELIARFSYHPGTQEQGQRCSRLRDFAFGMAQLIIELTPVCREQSLALTHLEDALQDAIGAIVRREEFEKNVL